MKITVAMICFWATLSVASAEAQQECPPGIPSSTPTVDFTDHGDGTVTHHSTGLMWKRCVEGLSGADCSSGTEIMHNWQQALQLADGHSFGGYSDWRLPNIKELASIVQLSCYDPAINLNVFPNDPDSYLYPFVWSGSPYGGSSSSAWSVGFNDGDEQPRLRSGSNRVRLVRGG